MSRQDIPHEKLKQIGLFAQYRGIIAECRIGKLSAECPSGTVTLTRLTSLCPMLACIPQTAMNVSSIVVI